MTDEREDIDMLAAEYVLGTLDAAARTMVAARRQREPQLEAAIRDWERRLAPLDEETRALEPPLGLFGRIEARLDAADGAPVATLQAMRRLERGAVRWRRAAIAASALAAALAIAIPVREAMYAPKPQNFVAVFQKDDAQPSFLLTIDLATRELTIRPVAAEPPSGRTYQLWIADSALGPAPQSLGLLDVANRPTSKTLSGFDPALLQRATFGISLEPAGGSPTGRPTGPALHGKLYPAAP
jgi:anti-sigma-K factor RskA